MSITFIQFSAWERLGLIVRKRNESRHIRKFTFLSGLDEKNSMAGKILFSEW